MNRPTLLRRLGVLLACAASACQREPAQVTTSENLSPDRLGPGEQLPQSETAFGLPLPPGMRLVREFKDAAYFAGRVELPRALEHLARHVSPSSAELVPGGGAVFARVTVTGDDSKRPLRVTVRETESGSQIHVEAIAPPPDLSGLSPEEIWRKAGRKPDGTPLDPNQLD